MTTTLDLGTIEEEAATCRAAWEADPQPYGWHVHHDTRVERMYYAPERRIAYIIRAKPAHEQALRLRLFRPVHDVKSANQAYDAAVRSANKAYDAAVRSANQAYYAAVRSAGQALRAAVKSAGQAHDAAVESANKAYDAAVRSAQQAYDAAVDRLHAEQCPNCPWDGRSIFAEDG